MTLILEIFPYIFIGIFGLLVGSFLNVCILRIPKKESVVHVPSHCFSCGKNLNWWELFPLFSYLALGGKCSKCKVKISAQYPIIEAVNAVLWMLVIYYLGFSVKGFLGCFLTSALLVLSVIDERTREIPPSINIFILALGIIKLFFELSAWKEYVLGAVIVSGVLLLLFLISGGGIIGGGDVKLMAACGLFLGTPLTVLSFFLGCGVGSFIHLGRMKFFGASRDLAMGPYLALGVFVSLVWGEGILTWYLGLLGMA